LGFARSGWTGRKKFDGLLKTVVEFEAQLIAADKQDEDDKSC
jgi:hypothetical protein